MSGLGRWIKTTKNTKVKKMSIAMLLDLAPFNVTLEEIA